MISKWIVAVSVALAPVLADSLAAEESTLRYCFAKTQTGGLAVAHIDTETGSITKQVIEYESKHCRFPKKVRPFRDGHTFLVTHESPKEPYVFVINSTNPRTSRLIELPEMVDELRITGLMAVMTCDADTLTTMDINSRRLLGKWDMGKELRPKGNGPQDIVFTKDGRYAVVTFQKDSASGKRKGSRLVVFRLPGMEIISDVQLPRDYENWDIDESIRKLGAGPEIAFLNEDRDSVMVTLDNYGALAFLKWSELFQGKLTKIRFVPTSRNGSWGTSFPDRGRVFQLKGREVALVTNAGPQGGAVLVDMERQKVIHFFDCPPGLETPHFVPELSKAFAVCPGKLKQRVGKTVTKTYVPQKAVYEFDFQGRPTLRKTENSKFLFQMERIPTSRRFMFLVSAGKGAKYATELTVFDPVAGTFLHATPAVGIVKQFSHP